MPDAPLPWRHRALAQLTIARLKEYLREPEAVFWTFGFPIIMALGLGVAFRNKPADVVTVAVARATPAHDTLAQRLASPLIRVVRATPDSTMRMLRTGDAALVAEPWGRGVTYTFDDTREEARTARQLADDAVQRAAGRANPLAVNEVKIQERGSRYIDFVVPGLLGMNIMGDGMWGLGFAIVEARRRNLLKRLVSTPLPRGYYLASFMLSRLVFTIMSIVVVVGAAHLIFGVPVRGSIVQLFTACLLGSFSFAGLGLLLASRARTIEGISGLMNLTMMPMWVVSGVFFSSRNFPAVAQPVIRALPLTALIDGLRATMLQGAGWAQIAPQLAVSAAWMAIAFFLALRLFRWR